VRQRWPPASRRERSRARPRPNQCPRGGRPRRPRRRSGAARTRDRAPAGLQASRCRCWGCSSAELGVSRRILRAGKGAPPERQATLSTRAAQRRLEGERPIRGAAQGRARSTLQVWIGHRLSSAAIDERPIDSHFKKYSACRRITPASGQH
jgi:hypothetical protein